MQDSMKYIFELQLSFTFNVMSAFFVYLLYRTQTINKESLHAVKYIETALIVYSTVINVSYPKMYESARNL